MVNTYRGRNIAWVGFLYPRGGKARSCKRVGYRLPGRYPKEEETLLHKSKIITNISFQCNQQTKAINIGYRLACHALFYVLMV